MTRIDERFFETKDAMNNALSQLVVEKLNEGIRERGHASLIVSGGSTPRPMFRKLAATDLDWEKVTITLADDRWIGIDHEASNEKLVRENLLQDRAAKARFIGLKTSDSSAKIGEKACDRVLSDLPWPADVLVLGMGLDGHTASLFPCSRELSAAIEEEELRCKATTPASAPFARMTLTLKTLKSSRNIFIQLTGEDKRRVFEQAKTDGPKKEMPIRYFIEGDNPAAMYWAP